MNDSQIVLNTPQRLAIVEQRNYVHIPQALSAKSKVFRVHIIWSKTHW